MTELILKLYENKDTINYQQIVSNMNTKQYKSVWSNEYLTFSEYFLYNGFIGNESRTRYLQLLCHIMNAEGRKINEVDDNKCTILMRLINNHCKAPIPYYDIMIGMLKNVMIFDLNKQDTFGDTILMYLIAASFYVEKQHEIVSIIEALLHYPRKINLYLTNNDNESIVSAVKTIPSHDIRSMIILYATSSTQTRWKKSDIMKCNNFKDTHGALLDPITHEHLDIENPAKILIRKINSSTNECWNKETLIKWFVSSKSIKNPITNKPFDDAFFIDNQIDRENFVSFIGGGKCTCHRKKKTMKRKNKKKTRKRSKNKKTVRKKGFLIS